MEIDGKVQNSIPNTLGWLDNSTLMFCISDISKLCLLFRLFVCFRALIHKQENLYKSLFNISKVCLNLFTHIRSP